MAAEASSAGRRSSRWSRELPPLFLVTALIAVIALVLPNALNVPQQDPSPVLEYAPVPPSDEEPPNPPNGNTSSLSLGSSSTVGDTQDLTPPPPPGEGDKPSAKRCVGKPLRQTEDPMAPPCSAFFTGDNFGETWQGVTKDEIRVLIYLDVGCPNYECSPDAGTYIDLDEPAKPACPKTWPATNPNADQCDYVWVRVARALSNYFNDRFQTYDRRVHYYAYMSTGGEVRRRRSDAAENYHRIKPFAVIDYATYLGNNEAYAGAMAARGVMVFSSRTALPNSFFRQYPSFSWGFWPDVEHWADLYSTYVCTRVAPFPVRRAGNPPGSDPSVGERRKLGLFYTTDADEPGLRLFAQLVKKKLQSCDDAKVVAEGTFPSSGFVVERGDDGSKQLEAIGRFRDAGVTTVLYLGGVEGKFSALADQAKYYPEIVLAGDLENDNNYAARLQNQNVWRNAWAAHLQLRMDRLEDAPGSTAYREASPHGPEEDGRFANEMYRDHFMLFQAIQVAGPRLTPERIDQGFHAIPPKASTSPYVASCYFDPGDYTCVKDATEIWWDPVGRSPGDGQPGCWRLVNGGRRYEAGKWPKADEVFRSASDPCTGFDSRYQINPN